MTRIELSLDHPDLLIGVVEAEGISVDKSREELRKRITALTEEKKGKEFPSPQFRKDIRNLLRKGGFKPTGRNKPASEYIANRAAHEEFPFHTNVVDIANYVSLLSGLPISILDLDRAVEGGDELEIRLGGEKESYVFNPAGQQIDLAGLLCVARKGGEALGNPVKDSMKSKVTEGTSRVIAFVYASRRVIDEERLGEHLALFTRLLEEDAGAARTETGILTP
jgi:DNA/RNA-binding domain of Phe-tRNA-synthetase-like protein